MAERSSIIEKCPGSQEFISPTLEYKTCPHCKEEVEIWTDEFKVKCDNCGGFVYRDIASTCIDWCKYAKECIGEKRYKKIMGQKK